MRTRLFVFGILHVVFLPALCERLGLSLREIQEKPKPAHRPFSKFIFKFPIGFQHTKFAAERLKHTSWNRKEYANGFAKRELDRAASGKPPFHRECVRRPGCFCDTIYN